MKSTIIIVAVILSLALVLSASAISRGLTDLGKGVESAGRSLQVGLASNDVPSRISLDVSLAGGRQPLQIQGQNAQ